MNNEIKFDDLIHPREAEEFSVLRARLRNAVRAMEVPPDLESRVRVALAAPPRNIEWQRRLMSIAAGVAVVTGVWLTWQVAGVRAITVQQQALILRVSSQVASIMRVGLNDHIHCAVLRDPKQPADPPELNEQNLGKYKDLLPIVRARVPADFHLLTAHKCRFDRREYVHFVFREGANLLSLVITRKRPGENFAGAGLYSAGVQSYRMTGFETGDYLVYLVSNLPGRENTGIATAMAPSLRRVLAHLEG